MQSIGKLSIGGSVSAKVIRGTPISPDLSWHVRQWTNLYVLKGFILTWFAKMFSKLTGIPTIVGELTATVVKSDGTKIKFPVLSRMVVTDAGVAFLADDWYDGSTEIGTMKYHGCGTDNTAEAAAQTDLIAATHTRATGTLSNPAANQVRSVATQSFTGSVAVVEHGVFSAFAAGTLWDRSMFAAINVADGDSIQWTYTCTINSGG